MQTVYENPFGNPGIRGRDGVNGASGPRGPSGNRGVSGPLGPSGVLGPSGIVGASGPSGLAGPTFIPSAVNPPGSAQTIAVVGGPSGIAYSDDLGVNWTNVDVPSFTLINSIASTTYTTSSPDEQVTTYVIGGINELSNILVTQDLDSDYQLWTTAKLGAGGAPGSLNNLFSFECSKVVFSPYHDRFIAVGINEVLTGPDSGRRSIVSAYSTNGSDWFAPTTQIPRGPSALASDQPYGSGRGIVSDLKCNGPQTIVTANGIILSINSLVRIGNIIVISSNSGAPPANPQNFNSEIRSGDVFMLNNLVSTNSAYSRFLNTLMRTPLTATADYTRYYGQLYISVNVTGFAGASDVPASTNLITSGEAMFPDNNWYCVSNDGGVTWESSRQIIVDPSSIPGGIIPAWSEDITYGRDDIVFYDSSYTERGVAQSIPCQYWAAPGIIAAGNPPSTPGGSRWYPAVWSAVRGYVNGSSTSISVWYNGYLYTLLIPYSYGNNPESSPTVWQKGAERDIRHVSSNVTVSSVSPYYDYNSWCAFFTNENYYNGRSGTAVITNAGASSAVVRGLNLYATITGSRESDLGAGNVATVFQYTVNGRTDIDLFSASSGVYFSNSTTDALLKNMYFKYYAVAGEVAVYGIPPASFTYMTPAGTQVGFTTSTSGAFDGKNWVIAGVDTDSSNIVAAPTIEDGISAKIPGSLFTENTRLASGPSGSILWQNIVWTGNVFIAYGQEVEGTDYYYTVSEDGIAWIVPRLSPLDVISDICCTPNTVTLTSGSSEYSRVFLSSNTVFRGSLTSNDYIHVKNISAQPIEIFGTPGINSAELQLAPSKSSNYAGRSAVVSYRGGPSGYLYVE